MRFPALALAIVGLTVFSASAADEALQRFGSPAWRHGLIAWRVVVSDDGRVIATHANADPSDRIWDRESGALLGERFPGVPGITDISPDGKSALEVGGGRHPGVRVVDLTTMANRLQVPTEGRPRWAFFAANDEVVVQEDDETFRHWSIAGEPKMLWATGSVAPSKLLAVAPDRRRFVYQARRDADPQRGRVSIEMVDLDRRRKPSPHLPYNLAPLNDTDVGPMAFSPDSEWLYMCPQPLGPMLRVPVEFGVGFVEAKGNGFSCAGVRDLEILSDGERFVALREKRLWARQHEEIENQVELRTLETSELLRVFPRPPPRRRGNLRLESIAVTPDGALLVAGTSVDRYRSKPFMHSGTVVRWNLDTGEILEAENQAHHARVTSLAFDPLKRWIASGDSNGVVGIWDLGTRRLLLSVELDHPIRELVFDPDGSLLRAHATELVLIDPQTGATRVVGSKQAHQRRGVFASRRSADGGRLLVLRHYQLEAWDETGRRLEAAWDVDEVRQPRPDPTLGRNRRMLFYNIRRAALTKSGLLAFSGSLRSGMASIRADFPSLNLVSNEDQKLRFALEGPYGVLGFSPDERWLAVTGGEEISFYDAESGNKAELTIPLKGLGFAWMPDSRCVLARNPDIPHLRLDRHCLDGSKSIALDAAGEERALAVALGPEGRHLVTASPNGPLLLWKLRSSTE